jgi:WD repeat-containing protein 21A
MVAALGSGESGGSLYVMDLSDTSETTIGSSTRVATLDHTVWTADCSSDSKHAAFGELIELGLDCRNFSSA